MDSRLRFRYLMMGAPLLAVAIMGCPGNTPPADNGPGGNVNDNEAPLSVTLGLQTPDPDVVASRPQAINPFGASSNATLPASADLTASLPPIGDQGQLGSCVAWATGYAAATYTANRQYNWGADTAQHQASPGYLYQELLNADSFPCGSGTLVATSVNILIQKGCASFAAVDYTDDACPANPGATDAENFRIGSFNRVDPQNRSAVKGELAAGRIITFGSFLWDDFIPFTGDSVYTGSGVYLDENNQHAGHAMAVVGYDDTRGAYRIMNSWSTSWGDNGFMWMSYETFETLVVEAYSLEPAGDREPPEPDPNPDPDDGGDEGAVPRAFLDDADQLADVDPVTGEQIVYLVFNYHFSAPVFLRSVTVTDPNGGQGVQGYNAWFVEGYVYFVQTGGFQWLEGTYQLEFDTQLESGVDQVYSGEAYIKALGDGGAGDLLCSDICYYAYDGECDDGGSGADYDVCEYGTDCGDCGPRPSDPNAPPPDEGLCDDSCIYAGDGQCDDGGPDADFDVCIYGSDCFDCGPRDPDGGDFIGEGICFDYCEYAADGECDDGGEGADSFLCEYGSDCADCGARDPDGGGGELELCLNFCIYAGDGVCDDGGPGALYDVCEYGTDCFDCGPRSGFFPLGREQFPPKPGAIESDAGKGTGRSKSAQRDVRIFRGIPVSTPPEMKNLPAAGVRDGVLGGNRLPATIKPAD